MSGGPPSYQTIPQYQDTQVTVQAAPPVTTQPVVVHERDSQFRDYPVIITDSKGQQVETVLEYHVGLLTWLAVGIMCLVTVGFGLCFLALIPFCIKDLKDVHHINPTDGRVVAIYKRI